MRTTLVGIVAGVLLAIPVSMVVDRRDPVIYVYGQILPERAVPGDRVTVFFELVHRRIGCDGEIRRVVRDSTGRIHEFATEHPVYQDSLNRPAKFSHSLILPYGISHGPAYYYNNGWRWCNVLQRALWPIPFKSPELSVCIVEDDIGLVKKGECPSPTGT